MTSTTYNTSGLDGLIWDFMGVKAQFSFPGGFETTDWFGGSLVPDETESWSLIFSGSAVRGRYYVRGEHQWVAVATSNITYKTSFDDIYVGINTP